MEPWFATYFERLQALHQGFNDSLDGLSAEALDWSPGPEINSLAVLAAHTAGAERFWIGDVAGQEPSGRVRAEEFVTSGRTAVELRMLLDAALAHAQGVLTGLTMEELEEPRISPRDGRSYTVSWALLHALEHTAQHLGHAQIGRQLWLARQGSSAAPGEMS
jgi:uncharacterized damage-inducible protein DinB